MSFRRGILVLVMLVLAQLVASSCVVDNCVAAYPDVASAISSGKCAVISVLSSGDGWFENAVNFAML